MAKFKNTINNHVETVDFSDSLQVLILGPFTLLSRGLTGHGFFWFFVVSIIYLISPHFARITFSVVSAVILNLLYSVSIQRLLSQKFLRLGWVKLESNKKSFFDYL